MVPSANVQKKLYASIYEDESINVEVNMVDYVEAHATSTQVGDKQEIKSIDEFFCKNRSTPLKIGSVKSNIGHAEGAAALTSLVKTILMFENQKLYPNLNVSQLRDDCPALVEKRIEVVQEVEPFDGKYIGLNSFGVLGANAHALIKRNEKTKINNGLPSDDLPRLLTWSGRTKEAVDTIFDTIASSGKPMDDEFLALLQSSQLESMPACLTRGFAIFRTKIEDPSASSLTTTTIEVDRKVHDYDGMKRPIVFVYSGVGSQWLGMGKDLMKIPFIAARIDQCHEVLIHKGIDLRKILIDEDQSTMFSNCLNIFVGIVAIQIALTDLLNLIGIEPDYLIGHSVGELGCAYADKTLTMKEAMLTAYERGSAIIGLGEQYGAMAAVGMGFKSLKKILPVDLEISCHNSSGSCTISGKAVSVERFVAELKSENTLAKIVDTSGVPFHSSFIADAGPILRSNLDSLINSPKKRSKKWISTSVPKDKWEEKMAQWSSAEYHANNMLNPVLFEEGALNLPENCLAIEVAPHSLLQSIVKQCLPHCEYVNLTKRHVEDGLIFALQSLGKIYQYGVNIDIRRIYPPVDFPVSRGTAMISPLIKWNHDDNLFIPTYDPMTQSDKRSVFISLADMRYSYMKGHQVDGRVILPAAGYLYFVWQTFAMMHSADINDFPICFEEVKFLRATMLPREHEVELTVNIQRGSGYFEIIDKTTTVACGTVKSFANGTLTDIPLEESNDHTIDMMRKEDFYKELRLRGYEFGLDFMSVDHIVKGNEHQSKGKIEWKSNWVTLTDGMLQSAILNYDSRDLFLPTFIRKVVIDPQKHEQCVQAALKTVKTETVDSKGGNVTTLIDFIGDKYLNSIQCGGIEIVGCNVSFMTKFAPAIPPILQTYKFVPHFPTPVLTKSDAAQFCIQLLMETSSVMNLKLSAAEIADDDSNFDEPLLESFAAALDKIPLVIPDLKYLTKQENVELKNVTVSSTDDLSACNSLSILIATNILTLKKNTETLFEHISEDGFLVSREFCEEQCEKLEEVVPVVDGKLQCIAVIRMMNNEVLYVINRKKNVDDEIAFSVPNELSNFEWVNKLKGQLTKKNTLLVAQGGLSGLLGFFKCLKKEPKKKNLRCLFIHDDTGNASNMVTKIYEQQLSLNLPVNVYKDHKWGTYRHLNIPALTVDKSLSKHTFVNLLTRGDITSLRWVNGNLLTSRDDLIEVHFTALNYRDVLVSTKRIILDYELENRIDRQYLCGYEFSGITGDGKRMMGLVKSKGISNFIERSQSLAVEIPDHWSLEEGSFFPFSSLSSSIHFHLIF